MEKIYVSECNKYNGISNIMMLNENLGLEIFNDGERKYIDNGKLDKIMERILNEINDMDLVKDLNDVDIHINCKFEFDRTIYDWDL